MLTRIPFHPIAFAAFPILALLAYNIRETYLVVAARPLLISLAGAAILFALLRLLLRNWQRTAMATSLFLILFFLYGHLYYLLKDPLAGWTLDIGWLERNLDDQTRLLIVNFPHNPTGYLPTREEFDRILELARRRGVMIFSGEMYRLLEYDPGRRPAR